MRNLYVFNMVTVDGFFEGPNPWDISWHKVDDEFNAFSIEQLDATGLIIFGRATYLGMAGYWASPDALKDDPIVAGKMNAIPKIVISTTLDKAEWANTRLIKKNAPEEILKLKQAPGKDLAIFGSAALMASLAPHEIIDEYRLIVNPLILGKGRPLFGGLSGQIKLELVKTRTFKNGNVLLCYKPLR